MDEIKIKKALLARQSELRARIGAIGEARLEALPYATLCIDDAKRAEQPT